MTQWLYDFFIRIGAYHMAYRVLAHLINANRNVICTVTCCTCAWKYTGHADECFWYAGLHTRIHEEG